MRYTENPKPLSSNQDVNQRIEKDSRHNKSYNNLEDTWPKE